MQTAAVGILGKTLRLNPTADPEAEPYGAPGRATAQADSIREVSYGREESHSYA